MIIEEIKNIDSSPRQLRNFAFVMAAGLAFIGVLLLLGGGTYYWYFFIASGLFICPGLLVKPALIPLQKVWMTFSIIMGWFMTRLILCILFFLVLTPMALLLKLLRKDLLNIKFDKESSQSYWIPRKTDESQEPDYTKQF
ncbi:MAG: SxtJ family membrane protein [Planctomycetota bacterium]|jgi:hypothetical protein